MRVLSISHSFPSRSREYVTPFISSFCEALAGNRDIDLHLLIPEAEITAPSSVTVHTFRASGDRIAHKGIGADARTVGTREQLRFLFAGVAAANNILKKNKIDIVHAHWAVPSGLVAMFATIGTGVPYVVTCHGRDVLDIDIPGYSIPSRGPLSWARNWVLRRAARVVATTPVVARAVLSKLSSARLCSIPMGIEDVKTAAASTPARKDLLIVGDLIARKGHALLLEAINGSADLRARTLHVVGAGIELEPLKTFALQKGLNNIVWHGALAPPKVQEIYRTIHSLIVPSRIEAFGMVVLEALIAGARVVGTHTGVIEMIAERAPWDSAVQSVRELTPESLRSAITRSLRDDTALAPEVKLRTLEEFGWSKIATRYHDVFNELLST